MNPLTIWRDPRRLFPLAFFAFLVIFFVVAMIRLAMAAGADTSVPLGPWVAMVAPFINAFASALAAALVAVLLAYINKLLGLSVDQKSRDALAAAAQTAAGNVLARLEGDLSQKSFTIENAVVREAVLWVQRSAPDAIKRFNLHPDDLAKIVVGKIGALQAQMTPAAPGNGS